MGVDASNRTAPHRRARATGRPPARSVRVVLDVSVVNVALPAMQDELHLSATGLQWVVSGYTIADASFLLLGRRLADLIGQADDVGPAPGCPEQASYWCPVDESGSSAGPSSDREPIPSLR
jgi:hypothetical protein